MKEPGPPEGDRSGLFLLWGKQKGAPRGGPSFHPLAWHALDAAAVAERLWDDFAPVWFREAFVAGLGLESVEQGRAWFAFLTALHDLGKAGPEFAGHVASLRRRLVAAGFTFPRATSGVSHELVGAVFVAALLEHRFAVPAVSAAVIGAAVSLERGCYVHLGAMAAQSGLALPAGSDSAIKDPWAAARAELVDLLIACLGVRERPRLTVGWAYLSPLVAVLTGMVKAADWLASSTELFPFAPADVKPQAYLRGARIKAAVATEQARLHSWHAPIGDHRELADVLGFAPSPMQMEVAAAAGPGNRLLVIEDETGAGKTEAVYGFLHQQIQHGAAGIYWAMPTRATSNQGHTRLCAWMKRAGLDEFIPILVHGHASLETDATESATAQTLEVDVERHPVEEREPSRWSRGPHRPLLIRLGVGTVDQILLAVQSVRFGPVRLTGLAGRVVVFDEVHAYDAYMNGLLELALQWLAQIGCSVVLLSATLPPATRRSLIEAFRQGLHGPEQPPPVELPQVEQYPRLTVATATAPYVDVKHPPQFRPSRNVALRRLALRLGGSEETDAQVLAKEIDALTAVDRWGRVGVVCNSVDHAQRLYRVLHRHFAGDTRVRVVLFHARFPHARRDATEAEVLRLFGKEQREARRDGLVILVATQIVEQSLDIDCDLLITEFTVVDLFIQRLGRMQRWTDTVRPGWASPATAWLVDPICDGGVPDLADIAYVYDDSAPAVLLASWLKLRGRERLRLPDEVPGLVSEVYNAAGQLVPLWPVNDACGRLWEAAHQRQQTRLAYAVEQVDGRAVTSPWDLDAWRRLTALEHVDESAAEDAPLRAMTRLGDPSLSVVLVYRSGDGLVPVAGTRACDLAARPSFPLLLRSTVALSRKSVVSALRHGATCPPAWQGDPVLRHAVLAELNADGTYGRGLFRYSKQLGVLYPDRARAFLKEIDQ
ncbi:CRISPR-associated helicase Cas3' [Frankia sp. Ag45/Mut15]|uniref:CRISPR-associated helicase Cas3 n=1 Tax=Frankia umida TaxID=573489 RepID=A0ABT0K3A5_9ACTN|nr:CRISPR-associated helicase Cas3' [Frankia umida]MCK9878255.1 CRISPR-associated helicase Cas3' [Frankia umida]